MEGPILELIGGLALLVFGAEWLVRGASRLAQSFGVSPLVIGLTVVAFGTSAPELAVSLQGTFGAQTGLVVGNVVGSNIFNILIILGLATLVQPLIIDQKLVRLEAPLLVGISAVTLLLSLDGVLARWEGLALLIGGLGYGWMLVVRSRQEQESVKQEYQESFGQDEPSNRLLEAARLVLGLALLVFGARLLVQGAVAIAESLGVSETIIGLTIIAAGTSLPEAATSALAAWRGERDIAAGNAIGSCILNLLLILSVTAVVSPSPLEVPPAVIAVDLPVMLGVAVAALPLFFTGHKLDRWEGALLVFYYVAYTVYLLLDATQHPRREPFVTIMLAFVLPITGVTLAIFAFREFKKGDTDEA